MKKQNIIERVRSGIYIDKNIEYNDVITCLESVVLMMYGFSIIKNDMVNATSLNKINNHTVVWFFI